MKLRPFRRIPGRCLYCGEPMPLGRSGHSRADVCGYCSHLPVNDPLVAKARLPLSEAERIEAQR